MEITTILVIMIKFLKSNYSKIIFNLKLKVYNQLDFRLVIQRHHFLFLEFLRVKNLNIKMQSQHIKYEMVYDV